LHNVSPLIVSSVGKNTDQIKQAVAGMPLPHYRAVTGQSNGLAFDSIAGIPLACRS
jgi:hypothetical protein